jgi:curved DNA-binding protein
MSAMMSKTEALEVLGLDASATVEDISTARRKLARLHHPDVDPNDAEKMAPINAASDRLTSKKNEPDPIDMSRPQADDPWADFEDWESEDHSSQGGNNKIGSHIYITADVPWEAANLGRSHVFTYKVNGKSKRITVKIPKGSASGKQIRCAGKGEPGLGGGIAGDLFITLNVIETGFAEDIQATVSLRLSETNAACIREINVVVDGSPKRISVRIPANVRNGQTVKVTGVGNKSSRSNVRGDVYVKVIVRPSKAGEDLETYATIDGFLRTKMALFNSVNVTLRDVNTDKVVYPSFKLQTRHLDGVRYYWDELGSEGDPGERRGKLWVTPKYTVGARQFKVRALGFFAAFIAISIAISHSSNDGTPTTYDTTPSASVDNSQSEAPSWLPSGLQYTDTDNSFAYSFYDPSQYSCSEDGAQSCIKLQAASEGDCTELDVKIRFFDSQTNEEEWAENQFENFQAGIPQDVELSVYSRAFDKVDNPEIFCSIR